MTQTMFYLLVNRNLVGMQGYLQFVQDSHTQQSLELVQNGAETSSFADFVLERCERKTVGQMEEKWSKVKKKKKKAAVLQITTFLNHAEQKSMSEHTPCTK